MPQDRLLHMLITHAYIVCAPCLLLSTHVLSACVVLFTAACTVCLLCAHIEPNLNIMCSDYWRLYWLACFVCFAHKTLYQAQPSFAVCIGCPTLLWLLIQFDLGHFTELPHQALSKSSAFPNCFVLCTDLASYEAYRNDILSLLMDKRNKEQHNSALFRDDFVTVHQQSSKPGNYIYSRCTSTCLLSSGHFIASQRFAWHKTRWIPQTASLHKDASRAGNSRRSSFVCHLEDRPHMLAALVTCTCPALTRDFDRYNSSGTEDVYNADLMPVRNHCIS